MKSQLLVYTLLLFTFSSYGQSLEFTDKVLDKMVLEVSLDGSGMITKELDQELQLTKEQYKTVELVNKRRFQQILNAEEKFSADPALLRRTFNEINTNSDKALIPVLSEKQLSRFMRLIERKERQYYSINQHD